ncbi:MAG TPA: hypothetical protein VMN78_10280 [Longimicrobiales bacterium]|nr:hypothetical protein [Longimicrobiales bacterium]
MSNATPERIRIVLRWIQVLETHEPFFKKAGEFRFVATVSAGENGRVVKTPLPQKGYLSISSSFAQNKITFDQLLFEDEVADSLTIEIAGEEVDLLSKNDQLPSYRRSFSGKPSSWIGWYGPGDDTPGDDPENLKSWRVCYVIEAA